MPQETDGRIRHRGMVFDTDQQYRSHQLPSEASGLHKFHRFSWQERSKVSNYNKVTLYEHNIININLHFHTLAVLPVIVLRELFIASIIVMASESILNLLVGCFGASIGPRRALDVTVWTVAILVILAVRVVLRSQMPIQTKQVEIVSILIMKWTYYV